MVTARPASVAIIGAGDYIGAAIARRFAAEGYLVFAGRRNDDKLAPLRQEIEAAGGRIVTRSLDARDEDQVVAFLIEAENAAPLEVCIFNVGANVNFPILETTSRVFRKVWEMACFAGFLAGREAARHMLVRGGGSIFFTGATAGLRGGSGYAAFASAKFGLRAVAQSAARELGPRCASGNRFRGRYRLGARTNARARGRGSRRCSRTWPTDAARSSRRRLLGASPATPRRVDLRTGNPTVCRDLVIRCGSTRGKIHRAKRGGLATILMSAMRAR